MTIIHPIPFPVAAGNPPPAGHFAFRCNACGQCCNTPPLLTLDELLRFETRFIGVLALRRVRPLSGDFTATDRAAQADIDRALLLPAPDGEALQITLQAIDYPSLQRCPARDDAGLCGLHADHKPLACEVVPLDALRSDRLQHAVLASRQDELGDADCIVPGQRDGHAPLADATDVVDPAYLDALYAHRHALAADKAHWGRPLYATLATELHAPAVWPRIPHDGFFNLSPAPLIALLATRSPQMLERCLQFVDAQLQLIDATVATALARKHPADRPLTQQLRGYADAYRALRPSLARASRTPHHA
ncbi:YkgJ family cysteine cluster protein [Jeongeupia chitinilytica]|uniref:YkgJ family cysteine cluster protein n=1 Tax=Jeongeupia chitinilytica TaxID=1041641 RepID=A0ABQ3H4U0_9NEIS|nr:YkgJ family cysteine cluster protein [Jeongeupia chitinilytica]GHD64706.1 hypothetical protein GCM10007350_24320 [Jeongeupia chitinilytica]